MRTRLLAIYEDVERRTRATSETHAWWPCRRGCDTCCRRLADVPQLVRAEWALLEEGLAALAPDVRAEVAARIERLADEPPRGPITCPMLDEEEGACLVYAHRPGACRTYGFYVERELGLHCALVTDAVAEHEQRDATEPVVWGNQSGVDYALARLAEADPAPLPLTAWLRPRASSPEPTSSSEPCSAPEPSPLPSSPSSEM